MARSSKTKPTKDFTPDEKLTQSNKGFVAGKHFNTAGEKDFGGPVTKGKVTSKKEK